jgi:hypothetical protein
MKRFLLSIGLCIVVGGCSVWAATIGTTNSALFGDTVDWGQLPGTAVGDTLSGLVAWQSVGGITGGVFSSPNFELIQQGINWSGNFSGGMYGLWNIGSGNSILSIFDQPIYGAGAYIQGDVDDLFNATISPLDSSFNPIDSFTATGVSNALGDGSALFIGMLDTAPEVYAASFSITDVNGFSDFAIGTMKLRYTAVDENNPEPEPETECTPVPEPTTLLLLGTGLGMTCLAAKRKVMKP